MFAFTKAKCNSIISESKCYLLINLILKNKKKKLIKSINLSDNLNLNLSSSKKHNILNFKFPRSLEVKKGETENNLEGAQHFIKDAENDKTAEIEKQTENYEKPLKLEIVAKFNKARATVMTLPHGKVLTPVYMPVGTKAAMKGLLACDMERMGCKLMLSNTYHLTLEPGEDFIWDNHRGIHDYMKWNGNLLTDSGGFQMVSLSKLMVVTEEGVEFQSHIEGDDRKLLLTPEKSIQIQNKIGSDIMMALDDVLRPTSEPGSLKKACDRTIRWIDRCINAHSRPKEQNLFAIVQGGLDLEMRKYCTEELIKRNLPGYAIGGLAGGEKKDDFWQVVNCCCEYLPQNKPRYLMGVGYPQDLVVCALLGVDMFDCVFATRTARFGTGFTHKGFLKLKNETNKFDFRPIEPSCDCEVCQKYTRAYFYFQFPKNERAVNLISFHNVYYLLSLMKRLRTAIIEGSVNEFVKKFFEDLYEDEINKNGEKSDKYPQWVKDALTSAGVDISFMNN